MKIWILSLLFLTVNASAATYYIDYNSGSDANNGTSKSTPWKRHPYMSGRTGSYTHAAGDRFIFKGGVRWDNTCFSLTLSTGGAAGNSDYYGVDKAWYTGGAWSRPIFDGGHTILASGANTNIVTLSASNITIDNIEITGLLISSNTYGIGSIAGYQAAASNILIQNCYIHNWKAGPSVTKDDSRGGIIFTFPKATGVVIDSCIVSNSEQSAKQNGVAIRQVNTVSNCTINDVTTAVVFAGEVFGNKIYNINTPSSSFDPTYHTNVIYCALWQGSSTVITTPAHIYNNTIHDINAGTQIYAEPCFGGNDGTIYVYNNVLWNNNAGGSGGCVLADPEQGTGAQGTVHVFNNTFVVNSSFAVAAGINHSGTNSIKTMTVRNNHFITNNTATNISTVKSLVQGYNITQSISTATAQGYTATKSYAPSAGGATIDAGTIEISIPATDILGRSRLQGLSWDVGAYEFNGVTYSAIAPNNASISIATN